MQDTHKFILDGTNLTIENIYQFAVGKNYTFSIDPVAEEKILKARKFVLDVVESEVPTYGINTGFGPLSSKHVSKEDAAQLQLNFMRSHCVGVGQPLSRAAVRAMMLISAQCLIKGYSGIQLEAVEMILEFLNKDIVPFVPEKGSVGASGDLAPLAHVGLCLIGEGEVFFENKKQSASLALKNLGLKPLILGPKDGLALTNGTHLMAAFAVQAVVDAENLVKNADLVLAMSLDGFCGSIRAFDEDLHALKAHPGQIISASNVRHLLRSSSIIPSHQNCDRVQDPYSFRCGSQVHGAVRQALTHAKLVLGQELQSVTDNPIVFADQRKVISGGHFHGEALAMMMDYLAIGVAELCNISERRVSKLLNPVFSQLPAFLVKNPGLQSGLMIAQYTAASLVSENKIFAHPASADSVSTSNDKEDHVSMGPNAGRKLHAIIENAKYCLAIEFLSAMQAVHLLRPLRSSPAIENTIALINKTVPPIEQDRNFSVDIQRLADLVSSGELLRSCGVELA